MTHQLILVDFYAATAAYAVRQEQATTYPKSESDLPSQAAAKLVRERGSARRRAYAAPASHPRHAQPSGDELASGLGPKQWPFSNPNACLLAARDQGRAARAVRETRRRPGLRARASFPRARISGPK